MGKYCGVRLVPGGKIYTYDNEAVNAAVDDLVVVETAHGLKLAEVASVYDDERSASKAVLRIANNIDLANEAENLEHAKTAFKICKDKIAEKKLEMKLFKAEYTLDRSKVMFTYASEARVDFRELVKELVPLLKTRIEMIQVGPREHAKFVGGLGVCGREFCCSKFMTSFDTITIKMAKDQGLTSNPAKYSGNCGKLFCCIKHEESAYEYAQGIMPKSGSVVSTPDGIGKLIVTNMLKETCTVKVGTDSDFEIKSYKASEISPVSADERDSYNAARQLESEERSRRKNDDKNPENNEPNDVKNDSNNLNAANAGAEQATENDGFIDEKADETEQIFENNAVTDEAASEENSENKAQNSDEKSENKFNGKNHGNHGGNGNFLKNDKGRHFNSGENGHQNRNNNKNRNEGQNRNVNSNGAQNSNGNGGQNGNRNKNHNGNQNKNGSQNEKRYENRNGNQSHGGNKNGNFRSENRGSHFSNGKFEKRNNESKNAGQNNNTESNS